MPQSSLRRNRDFMLLWSGETLSGLGSQISTVAYPLLVLALTGSASKAGIVGFAKFLPLALFALPAGLLADRVNRKRLMIACDAGRALALASLAVALAAGRPAYAQIVAVAFVDGALFTASYITERGALALLVPSEQLPSAIAQNEGGFFGASVAGPPLGGLLFAVARSLPFVTDALSYLASMTAVSLTRSRFQEDRAAGGRATRADLISGLRWLWRRPFFRLTTLLFAGGNPLFTGLYLLAVLLAKRHGASSSSVGVMFAIIGAGGLLGAFAAAPLRRLVSPRAAVIVEEWCLALLLPVLLVTHGVILIGLVVAAAEFFTPLTNSLVSGLRIALTPDDLRGRVQAAATILSQSLGWLGPLAVGFAFERAGLAATILVITGWAAALALTATLAPALRELPAG